MMYYTAVSALYRSYIRQAAASHDRLENLDIAQARVRKAARSTAHMCKELFELRLDRYLPMTGATFITTAIVSHMHHVKLPVLAVRMEAIEGLRSCLKVMRNFRDLYPLASHCVDLLVSFFRRQS